MKPLQQKKKSLQKNSQELSVREHIEELRNRVIIVLVTLFLGSFIAFFFRSHLFNFLFSQVSVELYFLSPTTGLDLTIKLSLLIGFILSLPIFLYQVIQFLKPIKGISLRLLVILTSFSLLLALAGICFSYWVVLPTAFEFLLGFGTDFMEPVITAENYISFFLATSLISILVFELPLLLVLCRILFGISARQILVYQRHILLASTIIVAVITPTTDVINLLIILGPLVVLYYSSVFLIFLLERFTIVQ